ncbi:MAG: nitroreductase [Candidatus Thorarchaeota archaeon]|nr:MAG: nitroreductase [Candidatus Thorarchaeota archaeon]
MAPAFVEDFQEKTKYVRGRLPTRGADQIPRPSPFKDYSDKKVITLPLPKTNDGSGIWDALRRRRSIRAYTQTPLTKQDLSQLLWATQGITADLRENSLRTAPSAGALYPVETYIYANRVTDLEQGLYHYDVRAHVLQLLKPGNLAKEIAEGALDQDTASRAAVVFIWSAVFQRSIWKYLERAARYVYMDVGHIAENLALAAEAIGLGSCQIGAFYDNEINAILNVDGVKESVIYLSSVGRPMER